MEATADWGCLHSVQRILPNDESRTKGESDMCSRHPTSKNSRLTLRDVEVVLWELHGPSACTIAGMKTLKRLSIRLDHIHITIDRQFWDNSPGSSVWNNLAS